MSDEKNPYLLLAEMGVETWNRWARTVMTDEDIDSLEIDDEKKSIILSLPKLNSEQSQNIIRTLGLKIINDLGKNVNLSGLKINCSFDGFLLPRNIYFSKAIFTGDVCFRKTIFMGDAYFRETTFSVLADFNRTTFSKGANFYKTTFSKGADFYETTFSGDVNFYETTFGGGANFSVTTFSGGTDFRKTTFSGYTEFVSATFNINTNFSETTFSGSANFGNTAFSKGSAFRNATFSKGADFSETTFSGYTDFSETMFSGGADFSSATFNSDTNFSETTFNGNAVFNSAKFNCIPVYFVDSIFNRVTLFEGVIFKYPPKFQNTTLNQHTSFYRAKYINLFGEEADIGAWRTLKLAMNKNHNHKQELQFFSYELDATRALSKSENPRSFFYRKWLLLSLYKWSSSYGNSIVKPIGIFFMLWLLFIVFYNFALFNTNNQIEWNKVKVTMQISAANMLPFVPIHKTVLANIHSESEKINLPIKAFGITFQFLAIIQNILSIILLFLMGLGVRHRLSIK